MADFHFAGSETTVAIIRWAIYYLASFPKVQKLLQEEIDTELVGDGFATMDDKLR